MSILLLFAFISGLATIAAPCIWPLLPIILSSSATGGHKKALGITLGVITSFSIFTLSVSYLVMLFHFDPNILRLLSALAIAFLGLTLIIPSLLIHYEILIGKVSTFIGGQTLSKHHGFVGGIITGLSLGIIWSPCAGPILATIATLAATQSVNLEIILVTLAFALGVGIPLLLFSLAGSFLFQRVKFISQYTNHLQKIFGVIMILAALAIYTNYDKIIQTRLLDYFPAFSNFATNFEKNGAISRQLQVLKGNKESPNFGTAPEFVGITKWLNTDKDLTMKDLKGKVVLIDFWTYTCINCIRTLPYVTSWYDKYHDKGFVVIGVHTPEFEFEKKTENVLGAIKQYNIHYPVAQDNDYLTWKAYSNNYWPAEYLIDTKGNIRHVHFGEGEYDKTEKYIQQLLQEAGLSGDMPLTELPNQTPQGQLTPETYLGSARLERFSSKEKAQTGVQNYTLPATLSVNNWAFGGSWDIQSEYAAANANSSLEFNFLANKVFLVITPATKADIIKVSFDGKVVNTITTTEPKLYTLVDLSGSKTSHLLHLDFQTPGTKIYAFTFGD